MPLTKEFLDYPERRYIMYGGKGGLGKTTFSAATAYYLAKKGYKTLVFSVDPQASLSDIFERDIFGKGNVEIMPNLYACEVDADQRIHEYQQEIRRKIIDMYGMKKIPEEIESYIGASSAEPAMEESAIFDAVVDIVVKGGLLEEKLLTAAEVTRLSAIPGREVLLSQVLSGITAPASNFVNLITAKFREFMQCLNALKEKKTEAGG